MEQVSSWRRYCGTDLKSSTSCLACPTFSAAVSNSWMRTFVSHSVFHSKESILLIWRKRALWRMTTCVGAQQHTKYPWFAKQGTRQGTVAHGLYLGFSQAVCSDDNMVVGAHLMLGSELLLQLPMFHLMRSTCFLPMAHLLEHNKDVSNTKTGDAKFVVYKSCPTFRCNGQS
jgi:hypothetical protein